MELYEIVSKMIEKERKPSDLKTDKIIEKMPDSKFNQYIKKALKNIGSKEYDYIYVSMEGRLDENEKVIDYDNLYEYYKNWTLYQLKFKKEEYERKIKKLKKKQKNPVNIIQQINILLEQDILDEKKYIENNVLNDIDDGFYLIKNDNLYHFMNQSLEYYIFDNLELSIDEFIKNKMPYEFTDYDITDYINNFSNNLINLYDANGKEKELKFFMSASDRYIYHFLRKDIEKVLYKYKNEIQNSVFLLNEGNEKSDNKITYDLIYNDNEVLKNIKTKTFYSDVMKYKKSEKLYDKIYNEIVEIVEKKIDNLYETISTYFEAMK
jgi:hypothetical protein